MKAWKRAKKKYKFLTLSLLYKDEEQWKEYKVRVASHWKIDIFKGCDFHFASMERHCIK